MGVFCAFFGFDFFAVFGVKNSDLDAVERRIGILGPESACASIGGFALFLASVFSGD